MHSYEQTQEGAVIPHHDLGLKEVKERGYFSSVTTKQKLIAIEFLDGWRQRKAIEYTENNPRLPGESDKDYYARIDTLVWQPRTRWDGVVFNSNDFGTEIHNQLERWNVDHEYLFDPEWDMYCNGWPGIYEQYIDSVDGAEVMVACPDLMTAGSIDLLAVDKGGLISLWDYKARPHKNGKGPVRDKDCEQLAIEADIVRRQRGLDYMPACYSVVICVNTGEYYIHKWTDYMINKSRSRAIAVNYAYNILNGFQTSEEAIAAWSKVISE